MANWHPQDGSHGGLAGAPDLFCYVCTQYCGGLDDAGNLLVCAHCAAQGLPPADAPAGGDGTPLPVTGDPPEGDAPEKGDLSLGDPVL